VGFFTAVKYTMDYKLYTLVDITHTGHYRPNNNNDADRCKEQNYNTVIQTLGLRSNIEVIHQPHTIEVRGRLVGFDTDDIIRVWRFDWRTEQDLYSDNDDSVAFLKQDFHLVPYIGGLDELMEQRYTVFSTTDPGKNIVFHLKQ
jgi:hypothetical protein